MQTRPLRVILNAETDEYLTQDNPIRHTNKEKMLGFFSRHGEFGRKVALQFKKDVIENVVFNDDRLLQEVYDAICKKNNRLKTSQDYRRHLMEGLCEYFGISRQEIDQATTDAYLAASEASVYGAALPNKQIIRDGMMEFFISERMSILNSVHEENKTFTYGNNNL